MIPAQSSTLATASARAEVLRLLDRMTGTLEGSMETSIDGLHLHRLSQPVGPKPAFQAAALSVIAQGTAAAGRRRSLRVRPFHYLISSVDLPVVAKVSVASPSRPYLGLRLDLHPEAITALISDENLPPAPPSDTSRALSVNPLDDTLLDALLRLLRLLDTRATFPSWRR